MTARAVTVSKRPARLSSAIGVAAAMLALVWVLGRGASVALLGVELVGVAIAGAGVAAGAAGHRFTGRLIVPAGLLLSLGAITVAAATVRPTALFIALLPGMVGVLVLSLGLLPVRGTGSRGLVKLGSGLVFVGIVAAALFRLTPADRLLLGAGLVVVAWDAGDNAIGIGEQLGTAARTRRLELIHVGATGAIAIVGVVAARSVGGLAVQSFPLEAFVLLLLAVIALSLALHG